MLNIISAIPIEMGLLLLQVTLESGETELLHHLESLTTGEMSLHRRPVVQETGRALQPALYKELPRSSSQFSLQVL